MWKVTDSDTVASLVKSLDAAALRQQVIANNIANINTPGFQRSEVVFEEVFRQALSASKNDQGGQWLNKVQPRVVKDQSRRTMRLDGNNVDIESEMAAMTQNDINYNATVQLLNGKLGLLRTVITEGRR